MRFARLLAMAILAVVALMPFSGLKAQSPSAAPLCPTTPDQTARLLGGVASAWHQLPDLDGAWKYGPAPTAPIVNGTLPPGMHADWWDNFRTLHGDGPAAIPYATEATIYLEGACVSSPPQPPSSLQATTLDSSSVELDWIPGGGVGATLHIVEFNDMDTTVAPDPLHDMPGGDSNFVVTGLQSYSHYCFYLYASNQAGNSGPSNSACADTDRADHNGSSAGIPPLSASPTPTGAGPVRPIPAGTVLGAGTLVVVRRVDNTARTIDVSVMVLGAATGFGPAATYR